jgi:hypothetical protein
MNLAGFAGTWSLSGDRHRTGSQDWEREEIRVYEYVYEYVEGAFSPESIPYSYTYSYTQISLVRFLIPLLIPLLILACPHPPL